jgi:hypothetical protein
MSEKGKSLTTLTPRPLCRILFALPEADLTRRQGQADPERNPNRANGKSWQGPML